MQFFASQSLAADISDVWSAVGSGFTDALKKASTGEGRHAVLRAVLLLPVGPSSTGRASSQRGYTPPKTLGRVQGALREDEDRRTQPDRLRRQGRLAGDGHVRLPEHADQRLRLPREADGRQGVVDEQPGQAGLRHVARAAAVPPARANGRTWQEAAQSLVAKQSGMYLLGAFVGEQFTDADRADLDFFAFPEINSQYKQGRRRGARSTGSWCRRRRRTRPGPRT
jgi:multiple sugar transport system substrate-binding protein